MKKGTLKILILCCTFAALSFTACNQGTTATNSTHSTESSVSSTGESNISSTEESSTSEESTEQSSKSAENSVNESSVVENTTPEESIEQSSESTESSNIDFPYTSDDESIPQTSHQQPEYTDNAVFNELFAQNALDASYQTAIADATESDLVNITAQYITYWQTEVNNAYDALSKATGGDMEDRKTEWQWEAEAQTDAIYEAAKNEGGSLAVLTAYTEVMNLYKTKAAQVYEQVYTLTGTFKLAYTE